MNAAPPTRRGLRARRFAAWILGSVLAVVLALAGIALGLRVASPGEYDTELGRVSVRVTPATHGQTYLTLMRHDLAALEKANRCS